jgi:hypothetical protein
VFESWTSMGRAREQETEYERCHLAGGNVPGARTAPYAFPRPAIFERDRVIAGKNTTPAGGLPESGRCQGYS